MMILQVECEFEESLEKIELNRLSFATMDKKQWCRKKFVLVKCPRLFWYNRC
jgi:hypothetical protein